MKNRESIIAPLFGLVVGIIVSSLLLLAYLVQILYWPLMAYI
jgi:hypothetical protein